jgi:hypothetical protein
MVSTDPFDLARVEAFVVLMRQGTIFPPIRVCEHGEHLKGLNRLRDGQNHRAEATRRLGAKQIE